MERRYINHYQTGERLYENGTILTFEGEHIMWGTNKKETIKREDVTWIVNDGDGLIWINYGKDDNWGIMIDFNAEDITVERQPVSDYVRNDIIERLFEYRYREHDTVEEAYFHVLHERAIRVGL